MKRFRIVVEKIFANIEEELQICKSSLKECVQKSLYDLFA